jgi:glycosyltransferase involved in cell wall biosynthesis
VGVIAKMFAPSVKLVTHVRRLPNSFPSFLSRTWLWLHEKFSDQVISVSKAVQRQLGDNHYSRLIYDGIYYSEKYSRQVIKSRKDSTINLLYLSHYIPGKGQDLALEAFRRAYLECRKLRLRFVGSDTAMEKNRLYKENLERKAVDWGISNAIEFGEFTRDVEKEIKQADVMLNFSESESFSFTCLEALFYGTPVIASDCGGPAELFEHGRSGYLVPNGAVNEMKEAILLLARTPQLRRKLSREGRLYVKRNFPQEKTTSQINQLYRNL